MSDQHQTNNRRAIILDIIVNRVMQNKEDDEGGVKFGRTTGPQLPAGIMLFFFVCCCCFWSRTHGAVRIERDTTDDHASEFLLDTSIASN
jgi:hypothetical protein